VSGGLTRRDFLKLAAITSMIVGVGGVGFETLRKSKALAEAMERSPKIEYKPGRCAMCPQTCSIMVRVTDGRAERIFGNPYGFPLNRGTICARGNMGIYRLYNPDRLLRPLARSPGSKRGEWAFEETSWTKAYNELLSILREKLNSGEARKVILPTGWATCDLYKEPFVAFVKATGFINAPNQSMGSCFLPKALGWASVIGVGAHPQIITDFDEVRYLIVAARNHAGSVAISHASRLGQNMRKFKLVVLDPRLSEEAAKADEWIPIRPGTDLAFFLAMAYVILKEKLYDEEYLRKYTNATMLVDPDTLEPLGLKDMGNGKYDFKVWDRARGGPAWSRSAIYPALEGEFEVDGKRYVTVLEALKRHLEEKGYTPKWAEKITDVPAETIERIAREFATTKPSAIDTGWHGSKTYNAFHTWRAIALLNALVGSPLSRGGILLSGDGVEATLHPSSLAAPPESDFHKALADVELTLLSDGSKTKGVLVNLGRSYYGLKRIAESDEKGWVFFVAGTNFVKTTMDGEGWLEKFLRSDKVEKIIVHDVLPQDTTLYADLILPDCVYLERSEWVRPVEYVPYEAYYAGVAAVKPIADCVTLTDLLTLLAKDLGVGKKYAQILAGLLHITDDDLVARVASLVDSIDSSILTDPSKKDYMTPRLQEIQAEQLARNYGLDASEVLEELRTKGFLVVADKEEVLEKNREILERGMLATPTGRVEIFSLMLYNLAKREKGGVFKAEWHPLIDWVPPRALKLWPKLGDDEFYVIYGKAPTMTHTHTADNPLLSVKLTRDVYKRVWIHPSRAARLGLKDGDAVEVCSVSGKCFRTRVFVTEAIRPDTAFVVPAFGHESPRLRFSPLETVPYNKLVPLEIEPVSGSAIMGDIIVKIRKA
jgi:anaerobic selenocysteine-containing dehydrogenase